MYKLADFEEMTLNPFAVSGDDYVFDHYEDLAKAKVFSVIPKNEEDGKPYKGFSKKDLDVLVKYIIILIDPESPLSQERNFDDRKSAAIKVMKGRGLVETGKPYAEIESEGVLFSNLVCMFFQLINKNDYEFWLSLSMQLREFYRILRSPLTDGDDMNKRRMLLRDIDAFIKRYEELELRLFPSERLKRLMDKKNMENAIGGYAEMFAKDGPWVIK